MSLLRPARVLAAALAALSVSACVSLLPETEPSAVYRLSAPPPGGWSGEVGTIIEVGTPLAPSGLGGDEIAILTEDRHLAYMAGAIWISPTPRLVQNLIIDTMQARDGDLAPARPQDGASAEYEMRLDLREFEAAYDRGPDSAPVVRVSIAARLIAADGRRFVGARVFSAQVRADENRVSSIVRAFDAASQDVAGELVDWSARVIAD